MTLIQNNQNAKVVYLGMACPECHQLVWFLLACLIVFFFNFLATRPLRKRIISSISSSNRILKSYLLKHISWVKSVLNDFKNSVPLKERNLKSLNWSYSIASCPSQTCGLPKFLEQLYPGLKKRDLSPELQTHAPPLSIWHLHMDAIDISILINPNSVS